MSRIRVRHLRLAGGLRDYDVSFLDESGSVRPLSVIAGEIATGKTSILDFINYCLGGSGFPAHEEIRRAVRTALLEIELDAVTYVIERTCVEKDSTTATVHSCSVDSLDKGHRTVEVKVGPTDEGSLSHFLLQHLGIAEVQLKKAPTQSGSEINRLSVRELLRLVYIRFRDLGTDNLLRENGQPVVRLKFEQVIDVLFDAHDNRAASVAAEINQLKSRLDSGQTQLETILSFLVEQQVPAPDEITARIASLDVELSASASTLAAIEEQMSAVAHFGDVQRAEHLRATAAANAAANLHRSTTVQVERLAALAAQYDQDIKKLTFASQASALFDPLLISVCPWCYQTVEPSAGDGSCSVCHQTLVGDDSADTATNIEKELRAIRTRRGELDESLDELHQEAADALAALEAASEQARSTQQALDRVMRARFAPYIDQRDALTASVAAATQEREEHKRQARMHDAADRRREELGAHRQKLAELELELVDAAGTSTTRADAVEMLGERYARVLEDFQYPKLSDAFLDSRYVPHVRGLRYSQLGSAGASTLATLAWYLALFETSTERGGPHPGLLLIDGPQKGLRPTAGHAADEEFHVPSIAEAVYRHLVDWSASELGRTTQLIVVDNEPQPIVEDVGAVIVRFTQDPDTPPYGLIDDATS